MSASPSLASRLEKDKVSFLLAQFVDIHGSPKVKMAPVDALDSLIEEGAGFAGGAVWGMGQGAHSHDMMGRIDTDTYTQVPWQPEIARFASDIYVDGKPYTGNPADIPLKSREAIQIDVGQDVPFQNVDWSKSQL